MQKINQEISFDEINKIAYASETKVANNLLHFFKDEYKKRINL